VAVVIDAAFLPLFAAALWREQIAARNGRNLVPCIVVALLALANIAFHLRAFQSELGSASERLALGLIALLIMVMGGRLVPSFTRNWLAQCGAAREPAPYDRLDKAVAILTAGALLLWQIAPYAPVTGVLLIVGGIGTWLRLARWRGWETGREPLVWGLHLGYFWLALGFVLLGGAICFPAYIPQSGAVHALTAGGIGVMTLVMMMRTTLSHTGRDRRGGAATLAACLTINAAAGLRVAASFASADMVMLLTISALLWSAAFLLFVAIYGPMLVTRRATRRELR